MRQSTESDLVAASRRGDRDAFAELVRRCGMMVDAVAYAATRDRTLADDIAQDTLVAAWRDLGRLRDASALRPWLCKIARNLAHKARRRRARERDTVDAEQIAAPHTPYDAFHEREVERLVDTALAQVPAPYRETLVLFYFEQQSAKAVAGALGIREDVVHQRLSRGRRHLAAAFEAHVATTLTRRRSRRDLAAAVLAAIALLPRSVHATPIRGVTMLNVGAAAIAVATVAVTTIAVRSAADAAPRSATPHHAVTRTTTTTKTTTTSTPRPRIMPATAPPARDSASCTAVVRHILDVSLAALESAAEANPDGVARVTRELEERCRREPWSAREIACMQAAQYSNTLAKCRPAPPAQPVDGPPAPVGPDVDVSCASVGAHMGDLMIESTSLDDLNNVAGAVLEDFSELPAQAVESCTQYEWSLDLRRCYAACDRYAQTVACNLKWR